MALDKQYPLQPNTYPACFCLHVSFENLAKIPSINRDSQVKARFHCCKHRRLIQTQGIERLSKE
jgi:hypothetical protein